MNDGVLNGKSVSFPFRSETVILYQLIRLNWLSFFCMLLTSVVNVYYVYIEGLMEN